jgi:hypothetical protein
VVKIAKNGLGYPDAECQKQQSQKVRGRRLWLFKKQQIAADHETIEGPQSAKKE